MRKHQTTNLSAAEFCRMHGRHPKTFYARSKSMMNNKNFIDDFVEVEMAENRNDIRLGGPIC